MRRAAIAVAAVIVAAAALFWVLTIPPRLPADAIAAEASGDAGRGARIFWAGGCASCHAAAGARGDDRLRLGGRPLATPFGQFQAPNISPDPDAGIGGWRIADFANAMQRGVDPDGRHLYPAFPYNSYIKMTKGDIADLFAYLRTLPPVATRTPDTALGFPYSIRRGVGLWKLMYLGDESPIVALPAGASAAVVRGRYLVEGPGHCGQCHTPRMLQGLGGLDTARWLGGAANPEGKGRIPNITPAKSGIGAWSAAEIETYLETGFTPDYDSVGGSMVEVQQNLAKLPKADRAAIAAYLKSVPAVG
ncbi:c-type cytochrome [Sandarakinorhabdus sp. DWP1-3-1]|uniref:cytochrome c n=1 Tax=Sandarakinorhabdus sp. DWP1-3-1 TaxID=2804627 RepID=UPI003CF5A482